jgi:hypothetical protein
MLQIEGSNGDEDWFIGLCNYEFVVLAFVSCGIEASRSAGAS